MPTSNKQFHSACLLDLLFELVAFFHEVGSVSIKNVNELWVNVDVFEEVVEHERVVTLWMVARQCCE